MIVSVPALSLLLSIKIDTILAEKTYRIWAAVNLLIIALSFGVLGWINLEILGDLRYQILIVAIVTLGLSVAILTFTKYQETTTILFGTFIIPTITLVLSYIQTNIENMSASSTGSYLSSKAIDNKLYLYQDFENLSALAFYTPKHFIMVDSKSSDLYYGAHLIPYRKYFLSQKNLDNISKNSLIIVPTKKIEQFYHIADSESFNLVKCFPRLIILEVK
jgi:hypothetical protein